MDKTTAMPTLDASRQLTVVFIPTVIFIKIRAKTPMSQIGKRVTRLRMSFCDWLQYRTTLKLSYYLTYQKKYVIMALMIRLVFDCLRSPYDFAHILQVALALEDCEIFVTGSSINHTNPKVMTKLRSWCYHFQDQLATLRIYYYDTFVNCIDQLKSAGIKLIGTSPNAIQSFYDLDFSRQEIAIVFGTESYGLSNIKSRTLDDMVKIPMSSRIKFLTLPVVVTAVAYEIHRQQASQER